MTVGTLVDVLVYLNDEHERTEDCLAIRACYMPPPSDHDRRTSTRTVSATTIAAAKRDAEIAIDKARRAADGLN